MQCQGPQVVIYREGSADTLEEPDLICDRCGLACVRINIKLVQTPLPPGQMVKSGRVTPREFPGNSPCFW
ncbi:MAG: hypothetical protein GIKADHBN_00179 [Phycisphaerales bacterium]|nr:hypothetical protein [Phycisphaerales bacterium]